MMKLQFSIGRLRIPLRVHWSLLLVVPWVYLQTHSILQATAALFAFSGLMLAHELGHAVLAKWRGLEVFRIDLLLLHGLCVHEDPYCEEEDALVAWGGVAAQIVVLIFAFVVQWALPFEAWGLQPIWGGVTMALIDANIFAIMLNLLPIAPLDGSRAWPLLPVLLRQWKSPLRRVLRLRRPKRKMSEAEAAKIAADAIKRIMEKEKKV